MHFFSSILFKSRSPTLLFPSSTTMETTANSQEEETGLKSLTSPSNHNHSSMINRFNISPQTSSSSCSSQSSPVSISPCCSPSSSSSDDTVDDVIVSTDEAPATNHHQKKQEEEEEITEKPFYDHRKNVIIVRNQRSGLRREFPPPIPLLARTENLPCHMPWVLKRSYTDGRLVIKEVNVKHHEYFRAHRSNGRLTLQLMHMNQLTIHPPPPNVTSSTTTKTDDIEEEEEEGEEEEEEEEEEEKEEDNVNVNDLVDFDNNDKDEKKNEDNKKDDDENDGVLSEQEQGSEGEEEEEVEKVERPSADPLHHIRQRFRPLLSSELPSSSLPQCQIHETKEGKQDFDGEILINSLQQPLILASSLPEGRVRGMCQPNDHRKSNLFRMPIASVRPVHS